MVVKHGWFFKLLEFITEWSEERSKQLSILHFLTLSPFVAQSVISGILVMSNGQYVDFFKSCLRFEDVSFEPNSECLAL